MTDKILFPSTNPIERLGGMERFLEYVAVGFQKRVYGVQVFHRKSLHGVSS